MITYKIVKKKDEYLVMYEGLTVFSAIRKNPLIGIEKVIFYDHKKEEILLAKHYYFLLFSYRHKIIFLKDNTVCYLKSQGRNLNLRLGENTYTIKYDLLRRDENLYLNGELMGKYRLISDKLSFFEHEIICNTENDCFVFSVMDILDDWISV